MQKNRNMEKHTILHSKILKRTPEENQSGMVWSQYGGLPMMPSNTATHLQNTMSGLMVKPRKAARISRSPLSPTSRQTCGPNLRPTMRAVVVVALLEEETATSSARIAPRENLTPHVWGSAPWTAPFPSAPEALCLFPWERMEALAASACPWGHLLAKVSVAPWPAACRSLLHLLQQWTPQRTRVQWTLQKQRPHVGQSPQLQAPKCWNQPSLVKSHLWSPRHGVLLLWSHYPSVPTPWRASGKGNSFGSSQAPNLLLCKASSCSQPYTSLVW